MKIAVIGSGISGNAVSYLLNQKYEVDLYEKNDYLGGHSNTVDVDYNSKKIAVDTGFIVFNQETYPNLCGLFNLLKVETFASNMSFSASINNANIEYSGDSLRSVFCQKKNIFNLKFWLMLRDILKFNKNASKILNHKEDISLGDFLDSMKMGKYFQEYYILPMAAAIWSCPIETMKKYPAKSFIRFFINHGLLSVSNQPTWYSVKGGSREYVKLLCESFKDRIFLNSKITKLKKLKDNKIEVNGKTYDKVILATHCDQALEMIEDFDEKIKNIVKNFRYQKNVAILHRDETLMPKNKKAWASWNYLSESADDKSSLALTYWMNKLQDIDENYPLFVTLNSSKKIDSSKIFKVIEYEHPIFDKNSVDSQEKMAEIQGMDNLYFCGAYLKYGFHEDGLLSAVNVAKKLGVEIPW